MKNHVPTQLPSMLVNRQQDQGIMARLDSVRQSTSSNFLQFLPDVAWVVDEDGHLINANPAFFKELNLDPEHSINQLIISLLPPEMAQRVCALHRSAMKTARDLRANVSMNRPGQANASFQLHLFHLPPAGGRKILAGIATAINSGTIQKPVRQQPARLCHIDPALKIRTLLQDNNISTRHEVSSQVPESTQVFPSKNTLTSVIDNIPSTEIIHKALQGERTRIGHELHDNVNQILSSAALYLDSLQPMNDRQTLIKKKGREYILLAIEEIRDLSRKMVTPYLDHKTFSEKLEALLGDVRTNTSLQLSYSAAFNPDELTSCSRLTLFRIIQEQVKNILTHSQATEAHISLEKTGQKIYLTISDNGIGFNPRMVANGVGFGSIMNRVTQCGGSVNIDACPGEGCRLKATLPAA